MTLSAVGKERKIIPNFRRTEECQKTFKHKLTSQ
nr:MAG TPA: hypothetical protein [Caudoviricetes sp.]